MIADLIAVVDLVVVVERLPLWPRAVVRWIVVDGPPPGLLERLGEREALGRYQLVVAVLVVDPEPRLQAGVRQPADAAVRRRGEEAAAGGEAGAGQPLVPLRPAQHRPRARTNGPAPPAGRRPRRTRAGRPCRAARSAAGWWACCANASCLISAANTPWSWMSACTAFDLVDDEAGGQRRGDRRVGDELRAEHPAERPDSAEPRERPQRPAAVVGRDPGQPQHRQRQQDGQYDGADNRADLDQLRLRTTDQGAQRLDPVPELSSCLRAGRMAGCRA